MMWKHGKPHLYKVGCKWYCRSVSVHDVTFLGRGRDTPIEAYADFKLRYAGRSEVRFRDRAPFNPFRF